MSKKTIIIIKKARAHGGHHGGAWKVAYADFVTAMMALFIVLWLMNTSDHVRKVIAGYFNDPARARFAHRNGSAGSDDKQPLTKENVQQLKDRLEKAILQSDQFKVAVESDRDQDHSGGSEDRATRIEERHVFRHRGHRTERERP